jgi:serine/threonine-protein kinase HipA
MSATTHLEVRFDDDLVGCVERSNGRLRFTYDDGWRGRPEATPLSLSMPLASRAHRHDVVNAYLWGLLPDNERVLERWGREFGVSTSHPLGLLGMVGDDLPGAVRVVDPEARERPAGEDHRVDPLRVEDVASLLAQVRADHTAWLGAGAEGRWSLAGAQPKIALLCDGDGRWGRPRGRLATNRILKPALAAFDDHDLNEHLCLDVAARVGLRAVRSSVEVFGDERAIVVERYDRRAGSDGALTRVHQEDLCQALGVHPARKYQRDGGPGAAEVVELLRTTVHGPAEVAQDVAAFVDALVFNWLIAAPDAHAKNYSVLLAGPQVRLAPLYDVASALPYPDLHVPKVKLAMKVGAYYRVSAIRGRAWRAGAADLRVDADELFERIRDLSDDVASAFADSAEALAAAGVASELPARLVDAVAERARACRHSLT